MLESASTSGAGVLSHRHLYNRLGDFIGRRRLSVAERPHTRLAAGTLGSAASPTLGERSRLALSCSLELGDLLVQLFLGRRQLRNLPLQLRDQPHQFVALRGREVFGLTHSQSIKTCSVPHNPPTDADPANQLRSEIEAFRAYAASFPETVTLLVDTYGTLEGVRKAIEIGHELELQGHALRVVRLDSGDFLDLSKRSRALLDAAGLRDVQVFASGGLDEFEVDRLVRAGAPIDGFGVGTKVGISADAPWTDCAYKLVEYDGRPVVKLSAGKQSTPGAKQVFRISDSGSLYESDVIGLAAEHAPPGGKPLLREVMRDGKRLEPPSELDALRHRFRSGFARLPKKYNALRSPPRFPVTLSDKLDALTSKVVTEVTAREIED